MPNAPAVPSGPVSAELGRDLDALLTAFETGTLSPDHVHAVAGHEDPRVGWILMDLLRFGRSGPTSEAVVTGFETATGVTLPVETWVAGWKTATDFLIAWNLPAPPAYVARKARVYTAIEPAWAPFFADGGATIDWRLVSWGGVFPDDRPLGELEGCPRGCIPSLDDPEVVDADEGSWYEDDGIVFGIVVGDEARAYPKHQMEVHELVLDTLGGQRLGIPYCTLCGSAQAYRLDDLPEGVRTPVLRTSGLLSRSNKVMFDLRTYSAFDTFTGEAVVGPLRERGVRLTPVTVVTTTWGRWRAQHPHTTILPEDGGIGRRYDRDPLQGRDDDGPIFPVGDVDPRLPVQARVLGVLHGERVVAFPVAAARARLEAGETVAIDGVSLALRGRDLVALDAQGAPLPSHEAFWFAWSQFRPATALWTADE